MAVRTCLEGYNDAMSQSSVGQGQGPLGLNPVPFWSRDGRWARKTGQYWSAVLKQEASGRSPLSAGVNGLCQPVPDTLPSDVDPTLSITGGQPRAGSEHNLVLSNLPCRRAQACEVHQVIR